MPKGLYREPDGWVQVNYGRNLVAIPRKRYELSGYGPPYYQLPTKDDYGKVVPRASVAGNGVSLTIAAISTKLEGL